jgi:hypothetical protein
MRLGFTGGTREKNPLITLVQKLCLAHEEIAMKKIVSLVVLALLAAILIAMPEDAAARLRGQDSDRPVSTPPRLKSATTSPREETPPALKSKAEAAPQQPEAPATPPDAGVWREYFG